MSTPADSQSRSRPAAALLALAAAAAGSAVAAAAAGFAAAASAGRGGGARRSEVCEIAAVNHVVRWGRDVCDTAYPVTGITDAAEGCQHEAGARVGRKGLHTMSKGSAASGDSHREENVPGQPLPGGSADDVHACIAGAWTCSSGA